MVYRNKSQSKSRLILFSKFISKKRDFMYSITKNSVFLCENERNVLFNEERERTLEFRERTKKGQRPLSVKSKQARKVKQDTREGWW